MKKHIIDAIKTEQDCSAAEAERMLDAVKDGLVAAVRANAEVRVPGLGIFKKKYRDARTGRNPSTGETIHISGRDVVSFKAAKDLI